MGFYRFLFAFIFYFSISSVASQKSVPYSVAELCASFLYLLGTQSGSVVNLVKLNEGLVEGNNSVDSVVRTFYNDLLKERARQAALFTQTNPTDSGNSFFQEVPDGVVWGYDSEKVSNQRISSIEFDPLVLKMQNLISLLTERDKHISDPRYKEFRVLQWGSAREIDYFFKGENLTTKQKDERNRRDFINAIVFSGIFGAAGYTGYKAGRTYWDYMEDQNSKNQKEVLSTLCKKSRALLQPYTVGDRNLYETEVAQYKKVLKSLYHDNKKIFSSVLSEEDIQKIKESNYDKSLIEHFRGRILSIEKGMRSEAREECRLYGLYDLEWFKKEVQYFESQQERLKFFLFQGWDFNLTEKEIEYLVSKNVSDESVQ